MTNTYLNFDTTILTRIEKIEVKCKTILVRLASSQQWVLCKCGLRLYQSSVLHIPAFVRARPASPNIGSKYLSLSKSGQRLRAEGILMPHLHKALSLAATKLQIL